MDLIEKKLSMEEDRGMTLWRRRVGQLLDELAEQYPIIYLSGPDAKSKAEAVSGCLAGHAGGRRGYFRLDSYDNQEQRFMEYLEEMVRESGAGIQEAVREDEGFQELLQRLIVGLQQGKQQYLLVFDRLENIVEERVMDQLALFLDCIPKNCTAILLENHWRKNKLTTQMTDGGMKWLPMESLWMTEEEIKGFFEESHIFITNEQAGEIRCQTGGMPWAVRLTVSQLQDGGVRTEKLQIWHSPTLDMYLEKNIWDACGKREKQVFLRGMRFPYLTEELCRSVLGVEADKHTLYKMEREGLLTYDPYGAHYMIADFMKEFMRRNFHKQIEECDRGLYNRAVDWFDERGDIRETIKNVLALGEGELLENNLSRHARELPAVFTGEELKKCLGNIDDSSEDPLILYLFGVLALWEGDDGRYKAVLDKLESRYKGALKDRPRIGEVILNLLYEDPGITIERWMSEAEAYSREIGQVSIYWITSGLPSVRNGKKDMTPLFIHGAKEERICRKRWDRIVEEKQKGLMRLASIEYLVETNREDQAIGELQELMPEIMKLEDMQQMLALAGILCRLIQRENRWKDYEEVMSLLLSAVQGSRYELAANNLNALFDYSYARGHKKDRLAHWILYETPRNYGRITRENAYVSLIKAKGLLMLGQYAKARMLFGMLGDFYEKRGPVQFQAESLFGEAVALQESGEKGMALKKAAQAVTLGLPSRYIGIYADYGRTGAELIRAYQEITGQMESPGVTKKKKYFYGNVLRASFEEYQSVLLRCAKKGMRKGLRPDVKEERADALTMTESTILQYINGGCSNQEIAVKMNIRISTVKTHIYHLYRKLGVNGRVAAMNRAKELDLL